MGIYKAAYWVLSSTGAEYIPWSLLQACNVWVVEKVNGVEAQLLPCEW